MEKLNTNNLRTLFEPFCMYLNNNLGLENEFNWKISTVSLERKLAQVAYSGHFHRSFKNKMVRYSSNFGNKLQMMVGIDNDVEFWHADVVYPAQIGVTAKNGKQPITLPNGFLYPRVEVEQRTHSGDEIVSDMESEYTKCRSSLVLTKICQQMFEDMPQLKLISILLISRPLGFKF